MRVSSQYIQRMSVNTMLDQQARLSDTQLQLSTGKKILTPADDPVSAGLILDIDSGISRNTQFQENASLAMLKLGSEESVLVSVENNILRARELAIQAANFTNTDEDRRYIAFELQEIREQILALANSRDEQGDYIFSGNQVQTQPFTTDAAGNVVYNGDQGQRQLQIAEERRMPVSDSGYELFLGVRNGNGTFYTEANTANSGSGVITVGSVTDLAPYNALLPDTYSINFYDNAGVLSYIVQDSTAGIVDTGPYVEGAEIPGATAVINIGVKVEITGQPVVGDSFSIAPSINHGIIGAMDALIANVTSSRGTPPASAIFDSQMGKSIEDLDQALDNILEVRTNIGARLHATERQQELNESIIHEMTVMKSDMNDLDYGEAVTRLNMQMAGLQAAQQTYMKVKGLSLFNYL
ncbi:MAG: flagellar hook-associated protein FlgL [Chromatiales bacterium]|nr:flagellar hook-associated protein FlgL [Chromatiales bacterium]